MYLNRIAIGTLNDNQNSEICTDLEIQTNNKKQPTITINQTNKQTKTNKTKKKQN